MNGAYKFRSYARRRVLRLIAEIDKQGQVAAGLAEVYREGYPEIADALYSFGQGLIVLQGILQKLTEKV